MRLPPEEDLNDWIAVHGKGPIRIYDYVRLEELTRETGQKLICDLSQLWYGVPGMILAMLPLNKPNFSYNFYRLLFSVVDFFNRINVIYGVIAEFCTEQSCPTMSGGQK